MHGVQLAAKNTQSMFSISCKQVPINSHNSFENLRRQKNDKILLIHLRTRLFRLW